MTELQDPTRDALAKVVQGLVERHGGPTKVGRAVGADRSTVHRWMNGDIGIDRLGLLAERLKEPIVVRFGPDTEKPPPSFDWGRLMERVDAIAEAVEARTPEERLLAAVDDETVPVPDGGAAPTSGGGQAQAPGL